MYYDYIIFKFIAAVYICINNKNTVGYEHSFSDLNQNLLKYYEITKETLNGKLSRVTLKKH